MGHYLDMEPIDIELKPGTKPYAGTYYNVPKEYEAPFKREVETMVNNDILKRLNHVNNSPWALLSFCQPKKMLDIYFLTNFWEVNKRTELT